MKVAIVVSLVVAEQIKVCLIRLAIMDYGGRRQKITPVMLGIVVSIIIVPTCFVTTIIKDTDLVYVV